MHTHDHPHPHPTLPDEADHLTYWQAMEVAVRELVIEKGILTPDQIRRQIEDMDGRNAGLGAKMVARAWTDAAYKQRMMTDGNKAADGRIANTHANIFSAEEGVDVGIDEGTPVTDAYVAGLASRFAGRINKVTVELR